MRKHVSVKILIFAIMVDAVSKIGESASKNSVIANELLEEVSVFN